MKVKNEVKRIQSVRQKLFEIHHMPLFSFR